MKVARLLLAVALASAVGADDRDEERACLARRQFRVQGACRSLGERGPCASGQLLFLDEALDEPAPVCKPRLCNGTEVWWTATGLCLSRTKAKSEHCRSDETVVVDPFGDARCECGDGRAQVQGRCVECYQRGPCREGQVVVARPEDGAGACARDLCARSNRGRRRQEYAPLEGSGKCHRLGDAGPCAAAGEQSRFVVDPWALVPRCSEPTILLHVIDAPLRCRLDDRGECRDEVEVEREDRLAYLARIRRDLARRRNAARPP